MTINLPVARLRMYAAIALISVLGGCAHQASTISINKKQKESIKLNTMDFVFMPAGFDSPEARSELASVGYHTGVYAREFSQTIKKVVLANGMDDRMQRPEHASTLLQPPFRMVARPTSLTTQSSGMNSYTTMNMVVTLHQHGVTLPIWQGVLSMPVGVGQIHDVSYRNVALALLNELQTSGVAAMPNSYAITPNGNKNYRLDVPTVLTDKSATGG